MLNPCLDRVKKEEKVVELTWRVKRSGLQQNSSSWVLARLHSCFPTEAITADLSLPGSPALIAFRTYSYWLLSHLPSVFWKDDT